MWENILWICVVAYQHRGSQYGGVQSYPFFFFLIKFLYFWEGFLILLIHFLFYLIHVLFVIKKIYYVDLDYGKKNIKKKHLSYGCPESR